MKITNEIIDMVFESMPFGAEGFLKNWGYRQFAHAIVAEATLKNPTFEVGMLVRKKSGSEWQGRIVGFYSTTLTPEGYAVESESHKGSVQIYPASALEIVV